jgi:hypothetical protein
VGGQTGYRDMFRTSNDRAKAIEKALNPDAWMDSKLGKIFTANGTLKVPIDAAQQGPSWVFDWLSDYNEAMENGVRLAAYKAGARPRHVEGAGGQPGQEPDGQLQPQGPGGAAGRRAVRVLQRQRPGHRADLRHAVRHGAGQAQDDPPVGTGKKIVYGGLLLGSDAGLLLAGAGFNDDDPPQFVRERSLIIPIGGKKYITIPMPRASTSSRTPAASPPSSRCRGSRIRRSALQGLVGMFADAFNPIGNAGLSMQTLAPTALDPLVALTENKDWTGRPIARTSSSNKAIPGHALARDTSTTIWRAACPRGSTT